MSKRLYALSTIRKDEGMASDPGRKEGSGLRRTRVMSPTGRVLRNCMHNCYGHSSYIAYTLFLVSKTLLLHFFWLCPSFLCGYLKEKKCQVCPPLMSLFFTNCVPIFGALRLGIMI